ncbi:MAG TPA: TetR/AcrR family transcriptional regulator [Caulobacteraceae bacterium]|jgi:AcrR family transcriptional regulator|nr:TetR/AcrR family transcriptional regulator [Caulobacteraceae bacterium]
MTNPTVAVRRPRNAEATRAAILEAAKARFVNDGYEQVGVRDIAADAGIDPALVNRYFGSKEGLFNAVLSSITKEPFSLQVKPPEFGDELARIVLRMTGDRHQNQLMALDLAIRSTNSPTAHAIVRDDLEERFIDPLVARFGGGPDAVARSHICIAITMGMGVMRGILGEDGPSLQVREEMIAHLAPLLDILADPSKSPKSGA